MKIDEYYPKYGLYAYSEGSLTKKAREMYFDGIPVLFIPGNAGSYKQVRSLASIALRKSVNSRPGFHFNYFTVDFNDEMSGLNGALLFEQTEYVNKSINTIFSLYEYRHNRPKSIVLVGHSMGGLIATNILASLPKDSTLIPIIITLSSPHVRPPVLLDIFMEKFYSKLQNFNSIHVNGNSSTIISISGGYYDFLVPAGLTQGGHLHVVSTSVPRVWLPADHLCILWCKQLTLAVNRAIFDAVDVKTKQISLDSSKVLAAFKHHLVHVSNMIFHFISIVITNRYIFSQHSGTKVQLASRYQTPTVFNDDKGEWIETLYRQYSVQLNPDKQTKWHMIRLVNHPQHEALTIVALNMEAVEWVFACSAVHIRGQSRICKDGIHLTHLSEIAPSIKFKRRMLKINMHDLLKNNSSMTHIVVRVPPSDELVTLNVDVYGPGSRKVPVELPNWWSLQRLTVIKETVEKAIHYELVLPQLNHIRQFYQLFVEPLQCSNIQSHHAAASLIVPWDNQNLNDYFT